MGTEPDWATLRRRLHALIRDVGEDIRTYPAPIAACDAQFNHLLELRRLLPQELGRLEAAARAPAASVEAFIRASPCRAQLLTILEPSEPGLAPPQPARAPRPS
jgi:hypothetical protein